MLSKILNSMKVWNTGRDRSLGWSLTASFHSLVKLANQQKPYLLLFTFFPLEVHGTLQNMGNFLHYIVEKAGVFSLFFGQIGSSFFFFFPSWKWSLDFHVHYNLPQHWGSSQRDFLVLILAGANCTGFLMSSPYCFICGKWTLKNNVRSAFKSCLELGKKGGSAVRRSGGNDNASALHCQAIRRCKQDVNNSPPNTWSQKSWEKGGQTGRRWKRWSELFSQFIIEKQNEDVATSLLVSRAFCVPWRGGYPLPESELLLGSSWKIFSVWCVAFSWIKAFRQGSVWGIVSEGL